MLSILVFSIGAATLLSTVLAIVATQLRQRVTREQESQEDGRPDNVTTEETLQRPGTEKRSEPPKSLAKRSPIYVAAPVLLYILYYFWNSSGNPEPTYRKCTRPPTAAERLQFFGRSLDGFKYKISTESSEAQDLFNQGLLLSWDFDQREAERAFRMVADEDANASMAHWGIQYAVGPAANRAVVSARPAFPAFAPDNFPEVQQSSRKALRLAEEALRLAPSSATAARDLVYAQAAVLRWPDKSAYGPARDSAEIAYAGALQKYGEEKKDSAALGMAAEALMNLSPWDYYEESGEMKDFAKRAEKLITAALDLNPMNPLANHLLIHISEASSTLKGAALSAHRGTVAADRLAFTRGPWSAHQGHLLHMPSHTFVRTGRYDDAVTANINAYNADLSLGENCMESYEPEHNTDMLIYAASMAAQTKVAEDFALRIRKFGPAMFLEQPANVTSNWVKYPLFLAHFARWSDIMRLEQPGPADRANCPAGGPAFAQTVWRFVRLLAVAAKAEAARVTAKEADFSRLDGYLDSYLQRLREAEATVAPETPCVPKALYMCEHRGLAEIFSLIAEARVALLRDQHQDAAAKLRKAVAIEDSFAYMEPPRVYQPVRQCLGFVLLVSGQLQDAEQVYREDLERHPENGWSLGGLSAALHAQDRIEEVVDIKQPLIKAWSHADVNIDSSCQAFSKPWGLVDK